MFLQIIFCGLLSGHHRTSTYRHPYTKKKLYSTHVSYVVFLKRFIQWQTTENKIQQHDKRHKVCIKVMSILTEHMYELSMVVTKREMEVLTIDSFGN